MCGIAGIFAPARGRDDLAAAGAAMAQALSHRGPDAQGVWCDAGVPLALGHRRLSIIDLSPAGSQPMHSADGRYVCVFNGEIYNYLDIREELTKAGLAPAWRGHSDTEVLLAALSAWGLDATMRRLEGMFAIAIWDRQGKSLHLGRDRLGEKPLYYGWLEGQFLFGSELKALLAATRGVPEIDRESVSDMMQLGYVPAPRSIFSAVGKLPAGAYLSLTLAELAAGTSRAPTHYWRLADHTSHGPADAAIDERAAVDRLERLLRDSVRSQMVADVPLGAFLSGGIDSSTVVALMQSVSAVPVKTFTIGFHHGQFDEADKARRIAKHLGTDHHELYVTPGDALAQVPRLASVYDEPFADSSQLPTLLVAGMARRHVTVALSGDGGDELFGGYNRHVWGARVDGFNNRVPAALRRFLGGALIRLAPAQAGLLAGLAQRIPFAGVKMTAASDKLPKLGAALMATSAAQMYADFVTQWRPADQLVLGVRNAFPPAIEAAAAFRDGRHAADGMAYADAMTYMPDDILAKVDRAAMSVSLETRVPMLGRQVVEYAFSLPMRYKIRNNEGKWILRQVLGRHVPAELTGGPKMGFAVPLADWLRNDLREWASDLLDANRLRRRGFLDAGLVEQRWREHLSGRRNWQYHLWNVLMFESWLDTWAPSHNPNP